MLYVPNFNANLLSVAKITENGYDVKFDKYGAVVYNNREEIIMRAERDGNAYYVNSSMLNNETAATSQDIDIWHRRLGHANMKIIKEMKKEDLISGINESTKKGKICESCIEGKMCRKNHPRLDYRRTNEIMKLWQMDLIGPIKPKLRGEKNYILLTFVLVADRLWKMELFSDQLFIFPLLYRELW